MTITFMQWPDGTYWVRFNNRQYKNATYSSVMRLMKVRQTTKWCVIWDEEGLWMQQEF